MIRFIHTADWQLGAGFGRVPGDKGALLRAERLKTIDRIGRLAVECEAAFVLVAGDLFDAHTVDNEVVTRAMEAIGRIGVPVLAIPGNHDFASAPESVYRRERYLQRKPDNFELLDTMEPTYLQERECLILPCPLIQRYATADPTGWLDEQAGTDLAEVAFRIGLAHGSVRGFESEEDGTVANLVDPEVVGRARLDYLALGDWHGTLKINQRAWYAGTPEPDRFKNNDPGNVLVVEIERPGDPPKVEKVSTARCRWLRQTASIHGEPDVDLLDQWFNGLEDPEHTLVRLELDGTLGLSQHTRLEQLLDTQEELLLNLRRRGTGVGLEPTEAEIEAMSGQGLTGAVVQRLSTQIERGGEFASVAAVSLQLLYRRTLAAAESGGAT